VTLYEPAKTLSISQVAVPPEETVESEHIGAEPSGPDTFQLTVPVGVGSAVGPVIVAV
jgi:hypothetical protein